MPRTANTCSSNFRFCPILRTPAVLQQRLERGERRLLGICSGVEPAAEQACSPALPPLRCAERDVTGLVRRDRERDAAQRRLHRVLADRLDVDRDHAGVEGARDPGLSRSMLRTIS